MNTHFKDARYYFGRAVAHVAAGMKTELEPVESVVRARLGLEPEELSRRDRIQTKLRQFEGRTTGRARSVVGDGRQKLESVRNSKRSA